MLSPHTVPAFTVHGIIRTDQENGGCRSSRGSGGRRIQSTQRVDRGAGGAIDGRLTARVAGSLTVRLLQKLLEICIGSAAPAPETLQRVVRKVLPAADAKEQRAAGGRFIRGSDRI